jgi:hypothetical protein
MRADGRLLGLVKAAAMGKRTLAFLLPEITKPRPLGKIKNRFERLDLRLVSYAIEVLRLAPRESLRNRVHGSGKGLIGKSAAANTSLDVSPSGGVLERGFAPLDGLIGSGRQIGGQFVQSLSGGLFFAFLSPIENVTSVGVSG